MTQPKSSGYHIFQIHTVKSKVPEIITIVERYTIFFFFFVARVAMITG